MKHSSLLIFTFFFCSFISNNVIAQQVSVSSTGNLNFGSFSARSGGTIEIAPDGSSTTSGDIILLNFRTGRSTATIALSTNANKGILVTVSANPITLTGPGGSSLELTVIFDRDSFILYKGIEYIQMGGTLKVGPGATKGNYFVADIPVTFSYQ